VNSIDQILGKVMEKVESWRLHNGKCISSDPQITAFHLACLLEEKFRVYALRGYLANGIGLRTHALLREDIFALEWSLRSLTLPSNEYFEIRKLRNNWSDEIASKCQKFLSDISNYYHIRDLVICAKRGGYIVETPKPDMIVFKNTKQWIGERDFKSRIIGQHIAEDHRLDISKLNKSDLNLSQIHLYDDFPHGLITPFFSSSDFWEVWNYIFVLCANSILESCKIHETGEVCMTSDTKELTILVTKKKLVEQIHQNTKIPTDAVKAILNWIIFNSSTKKKFTLFHCPVIEINKNFVLIAPHAVMMAHVPTTFLRLLAHYDKNSLNQASSTLEKGTLNRLKKHIEGKDIIVRTGLKIGKKTEIDIVEYNEYDSTLCIGQAKLIIRPDSVSEVDSANKTLEQGIKQLKKNKELLEDSVESIDLLFEKLGVERKADIELKYFLLPTSFTGSDFLLIPDWVKTMPVEFCLRPQCKGKSLCSIWADYKKLWDSLDNKVESSQIENEFELAGFKIVWPGFGIGG